MAEAKRFYKLAENFYNLALREENFFRQRGPLRDCVKALIKAYDIGEIETRVGLPLDSSDIIHLDRKETSELIEKLKDFFPTAEDFPELIKQEQSYYC